METPDTKAKPAPLSEEEVRVAAEGRSEDVLGKRRPVSLSEEELKAAAAGKSEEVMQKKTGAAK